MHRSQGLTEWFDEHVNDVKHILWPSQSPKINPGQHLWELPLQQCSPPSPKPQVPGKSFERSAFIFRVQLQRRVQSMRRSTDAPVAQSYLLVRAAFYG